MMLLSTYNRLNFSILLAGLVKQFSSSLYTFITPLLVIDFFPDYDYKVGLILAYSIWASSSISRPIGSFLFGMIAIKRSPIASIKISLLGSAITTLLTAIIPTYLQIGIFAPLILVVLRCLEGGFCGGDSAISKLLIVENSSDNNKFKSSYYYQFSSMIGIILASSCASMIFMFELPNYSWRLFYLLSAFLLIIAFYLRLSEGDLSISDSRPKSFENILRYILFNKLSCLKVAITTGVSYITYLIGVVLLNIIMPEISDTGLSSMMSFSTILLVIDMCMIPIFGSVLHKYNPRNIILYSSIMMFVFIPTMLYFMEGASVYYIASFRILTVCLGVIFICPMNLYYTGLFKGEAKYLAFGISSAVGAAVIGKSSAPMALYLWHINGGIKYISFYFGLIMLLNIYIIIKE